MGSGLNLIPAHLLFQRRGRRKVRRGLSVVAVYLSVLLLGTLGFLGTTAPRSAMAAAGDLAVSSDRLAMLRQQVENHREQLVQTRRRIEGGRVLSERPDWSTLLKLIGQSAGPQIVLSELRLGSTGPTVAAGAMVQIGGIAEGPADVSAFALRLEATRLFDRVSIESSRREPVGARVATGFTLRCTLRGGDTPTAPAKETR